MKPTAHLLINSHDRDIPTQNSNSFKYILNGVGALSVNAYRVTKVCVPYSFYSIPQQTFRLFEGAMQYDPVLPGGNYTASELIAQLIASFAAAGAPGVYAISYSRITQKFTISIGAGVFNLDFPNLPGYSGSLSDSKNLGVLMGLIATNNTGGTATAAAASFTSPFAANLGGIKRILVQCNELDNNYTSISQKRKSSIIAAFDIGAERGDYIIYQSPTEDWLPLGDRFSSMFNFRLLDENEELIDLNGRDWTIDIYLARM